MYGWQSMRVDITVGNISCWPGAFMMAWGLQHESGSPRGGVRVRRQDKIRDDMIYAVLKYAATR